MTKYTVSVEIDIPHDRNGCLVASPSGVLSYIKSSVNSMRGCMHPDDGIQLVDFKCSRIKKVKE